MSLLSSCAFFEAGFCLVRVGVSVVSGAIGVDMEPDGGAIACLNPTEGPAAPDAEEAARPATDIATACGLMPLFALAGAIGVVPIPVAAAG